MGRGGDRPFQLNHPSLVGEGSVAPLADLPLLQFRLKLIQ